MSLTKARKPTPTFSTQPVVYRRDSRSLRRLDQAKNRLVLLAIGFCVAYGMLVFRLCDVAFVMPETPELSSEMALQPLNRNRLRGPIYDRNGELLASSIQTRSLFANPRLVKRFGADEVASKLVEILPHLDEEKLRRDLNSDRAFVYIQRHLTPAQQEQLNALGVPGLEFEEEEKRLYPHGSLFAHVLGYVDIDNKGLAGVEKHFDQALREEGEAVELSVDARVQHILRDALQEGIEEFQAIGAAGIIMDMQSGELLALASLPDFDPNHPGDAPPENRYNRATYGVYEMGSTFKTFTTAMALHYGTTKMQEGYDARNPIRYAGHTIRDSHPEKRWLSVPEIFIHSSNIGTVKMVMEVGRERQKDFLKQLGLLDAIEFELPATASPLVPSRWRDINMMTISYGHGISVTPMHLVRAVASLLGPGYLLQPTLMKNGNLLAEEDSPRIVSQEVTRDLRRLMRAVVKFGTGSKADAAGYRVGGKTGTAEKVKSGGYNEDDKLASFLGVFPSEEPRYAILVMVDEPRGNKSTYGYATGGWVAAPIVGKVVEKMAPLYGIRPVYEVPIDSPRKANKRKKFDFQKDFLHAISF